jgi:glycosyltransferase involved in cell wall biosynthesis
LCYWLVEGLVARGHEVVLVAAGEDHTSARLARSYEVPPTARLGQALPELVHAATAYEALRVYDLDLVHDHSAAGPLLAPARPVPTVVTAHGPVDGELGEYYRHLSGAIDLVAISDDQRRAAPDLPWVATVHNAIPVAEYPFEADKDDFCLFLGRMSPDKGPDLAIAAARAAGRPLVIAGKCNEESEKRFFEERVAPLLGPDIDWIGEADAETKKRLLARAWCLVFPICWREPFGIVMAEAQACGTPVVTLARGSAPEVVEHGVTGFVCSEPKELPAAIERAGELDRGACRRRAEELFDVPVMVEAYERVYRDVVAERRARQDRPAPSADAGRTAMGDEVTV